MKSNIYALGLMLITLFAISCGKEEENITSPNLVSSNASDVIVQWNDLFLDVERYAGGYRPGPAPRAMALIGLANYEACITGMPNYNSVANLYSGLKIPSPESGKKYHWPTVVNAATAQLMTSFFPNVPKAQLDKMLLLETNLNNLYFSEPNFESSKAYGKEVAKAVWEWSKTDTYGHDAYKDPFGTYRWEDNFKGDGNWVPTVPGPTKPMYPLWGKVRTFAISEADKLCPPPFAYSTSKSSNIYAQALEVYAQSGPTVTYEGKWIGQFWSDDLLNLTFSPGPRWMAIANQVYVKEKSNLETALFTNIKVGMAVSDAAVACWHSKYYYNVERPASYIKRLIDPNFKPPLDNPTNGDVGFTPPFPAYPSGHSTMGAAGAEVLSSVFGYDYAMTDNCHKGRTDFIGAPRSYGSFYEMAEENAWSRVPLGVHYRMDCEQGVNLGIRCGRKVNAIAWKK